jgi:hypothetical protein
MTGYVNAFTASGARSRTPIMHASPTPPEPIVRKGSGVTRYRARCGAEVSNITRETWPPNGPGRRCSDCVTATR